MKINLNIKERLLLIQYLTTNQPMKGKYLDFLKYENIRKKIFLSNEEMQSVSMIENEDGRLTWDPKKELPVEFDLLDNEIELITNICKVIDEKEEVTPDNFSLIYKFIQL